MIYNKPAIPKGTRYFWGVSVPYIIEYQRLNNLIYGTTVALKRVKFAENARICGSFW